MPVLYGIFLYMGISSLNDIQLMHRLIIIFMPEKHQPDYKFLRHVRTLKVHMFTFIQVSCLALLLIIKTNKQTAITFPLMVKSFYCLQNIESCEPFEFLSMINALSLIGSSAGRHSQANGLCVHPERARVSGRHHARCVLEEESRKIGQPEKS